jgi:phage-related minor tail protein
MPSQAVLDLLVRLKDEATKGFGTIADAAGNLGLVAGGVAAAGVVALGAAVIGVGGAALDTAGQVNQASNDMQASLGLTADQADELGQRALKVWGENWGSSIEDVSASIITVRQQMQGLADQELERVTQGALALRDTFGIEVAESTNAANTLMKNFGLTSQEAFDFITKGNQAGLNASGDFLDTIGEYSVQFRDGGASAAQFFSLLESGLQGGMLGTDKAADLFKEFRLRIGEDTVAVRDELANIGLNADEFFGKLRSGKMTTADAFQLIQEQLRTIEDPLIRQTAAVALMGTQFEDLGGTASLAIDLAGTSLDELAGATDSLNAKYDNWPAMWEGIKRSALVAIEPLGESLLGLVNDVMPTVQAGLEWFKVELPPMIATASAAVGVAMAFIGDTAIPALLQAWSFIQPAVDAILPLFTGEMPAALGQTGETFVLLGGTVTSAMALIQAIITQVLPQIVQFWNDHGAQIMAIVKNNFDFVISVINAALILIQGIIKVATAAINGDWSAAWAELQSMSASFVQAISTVIKNFLELIASYFNTSLSGIVQTWTDNWNMLVDIATQTDWGAVGMSVVTGILSGLASNWASLTSWVSSKIGSLVDSALSAIGAGSPARDWMPVGEFAIQGLMVGLSNTLPALSSLITGSATTMTDTMAAGLKRGQSALGTAYAGVTADAGQATEDIRDAFGRTDIADALYQLGQDALAGFSDGIRAATRGVISVINSTANTVEDAFKGAFGAHSPATRMVPLGVSVIEGVMQGAQDTLPLLRGSLRGSLSGLPDDLKTVVPAAKFMPVGNFAVEGILQGFQDLWPSLQAEVSALGDDLVATAMSIAQATQKALASAFSSEESMDRQIASNLDKLKDVLPQYLQYTQGALAQVQKEAEQMLDPAQGAKWFKMRSDQILEYAALQKKLSEAAVGEDRDRIQAQMLLISEAHRAAIKAFEATQAGATNPYQSLIDQIGKLMAGGLPVNDTGVGAMLVALLNQLQTVLGIIPQKAMGGPVDQGRPYWVGERGPELFVPRTSGQIVPNGASAAGMTFNNTFNNTFVLPPGTPAQLVDMVLEKLNRQVKGRR